MNLSSIQSKPQVQQVTVAPLLLQGAITTTTSTTVAFNFNAAPIVPEPEPVLVEGATLAEAEAAALDPESSTEAPPIINGGVILAPESESTELGQERLTEILTTEPEAVTAGSRVLAPIDCTGMNGRDCCLAIKHQVQDSDIYVSILLIFYIYLPYNMYIKLHHLTFLPTSSRLSTQGNAIQCFLDYDDSTCKKTWWRDILETKRVMIYQNHEGFVSKDPIVEGAWPSCELKWGATHDLSKCLALLGITTNNILQPTYFHVAHLPILSFIYIQLPKFAGLKQTFVLHLTRVVRSALKTLTTLKRVLTVHQNVWMKASIRAHVVKTSEPLKSSVCRL